MKNLLTVTILSTLITLSQAMAGVGLEVVTDEDGKLFDYAAVVTATRGGVIESKSEKTEGIGQRLVCVDQKAQTMDECDHFHFALLHEEKIVNDQLFVNITFRKYAPELKRADLESMDTLIHALKLNNPKFKTNYHLFSETLFISGYIAILPIMGPQDRPVIVDLLLLPISLAAGVASVPVTATIGVIRSTVVQNKMKKFLNSLVEDDGEVLVKFNKSHFSETIFRN